MSVSVMNLNSSPPTCPGEPLLDEALNSLPGFFLAYSTISGTDLNGTTGETASSRCPRVTSAIGWKSRSMSYGSFATMWRVIASAPIGPMQSV
jgi:hypothetical protein